MPNHFQEISQSSQPSRLQKKDMENGFGLTFEQEQTADQLLADIQSAVDEMLQEFQMSPLPPASEATVTSPVSGLPTLLHRPLVLYSVSVYGNLRMLTVASVELVVREHWYV